MKRKTPSQMLIIGNGSLFDDGLEKLLSGKPGLEVSHITYTDDAAVLHQFLQKLPEVVVLFEGSPLSVSRLFELVKDTPISNLQIITVVADTNAVEVYAKRQIAVVDSEDFLALVRS